MRVVLDESADAHQTVQGAPRFVAVTLAELGQPQRQVPPAPHALVENLHMARAVHRLDDQARLLLGLRQEHRRRIGLEMPRLRPERFLHQLRGDHFLVAASGDDPPHVGPQDVVEKRTLRVPEYLARRVILDMKKVQLLPELAVVAKLRLLALLQERVELLRIQVRRRVDALEHRIRFLAPIIRTRHVEELEVADLARALRMRAATEIHELAALVEGDRLALGNVRQTLDLVALAHAPDQLRRLVAADFNALERMVLGNDLRHLLLDPRKVFGRKAMGQIKVVVEAVLGGRTNVQLDILEDPANGGSHHMRRAVAHAVQLTRRI